MECGGNRRQKAVSGRLDAADGQPTVVSRQDDKWHVMVIEREPGEFFVGGTMAHFTGAPPFGWVERIDPDTLAPLTESGPLPCGDHVWCGAILAHANGSLLSVNGSYLHRLDPTTLTVEAERQLPADRSHNGLLALADGSLITKDLRLVGQGGTTISRLDPDTLDLVSDPLILPEGSMGRIASDLRDGIEHVVVPGTEQVFTIVVDGDDWTLADNPPRYRTPDGPGGLAWDSCLSGGAAWLMDCGDIESVRMIHHQDPNGRWAEHPGRALSWRQPAPWDAPQRLLRVDLESGQVDDIAPFGEPGGGIIAPPVVFPERELAIAWDSINGGLAGVSTGDGLDVHWQLDVRPTMQPVVYPDSGELVINDFTDEGADDLVVVDVDAGAIVSRASTGSRIANGMFLSPGPERSVFYCSTLTLARVQWS